MNGQRAKAICESEATHSWRDATSIQDNKYCSKKEALNSKNINFQNDIFLNVTILAQLCHDDVTKFKY